MLLVILGSFWILFHVLTLEYEYSYPKDEFCFNEKFRKLVFGPQTQIFHINFSERRAEISNVRPRFRTSGRDFERPAEIPHVGGLEFWKRAIPPHLLRFWNFWHNEPEGSRWVGDGVSNRSTEPPSTRRGSG